MLVSPTLSLVVVPQSGSSLPQHDPKGAGVEPRPAAPALEYAPSQAGLGFPLFEAGHTQIEFGDTNGDGHLDLLSIGDHGSPFVNTQEHGIMTCFGEGNGGIAVGDANNDGLPDVLSNSFGCCAGTHVYRNQGDGTGSFVNRDGNLPGSALDHNGRLDLALVQDESCGLFCPAGPWSVLAAGVPNDGYHQVRVPTGSTSDECLVRVVVRAAGRADTAQSSAPFRIVP